MTEPTIIEPKEGELLPCPFCGSPCAFEHDNDSMGQWRVFCRDHKDDAGCAIGLNNSDNYSRRVDAATAWNKRSGACAQEGREPSIEMVAAAQEAITKHPHFHQSAATAFGFANVALKAALNATPGNSCTGDLESRILQYADDLRHNRSGGDDYPWNIMTEVADYLEVLVRRSHNTTKDKP